MTASKVEHTFAYLEDDNMVAWRMESFKMRMAWMVVCQRIAIGKVIIYANYPILAKKFGTFVFHITCESYWQ